MGYKDFGYCNFALSNPDTMRSREKAEFMLLDFSTLQFSMVLLVLGLLWYGGVLIFFHLKKNSRPSEANDHRVLIDDPLAVKHGNTAKLGVKSGVTDGLVGKVSLPEGMSLDKD
ncbi:hypothetical protein [Pedobacter terrae]|nr:hypothetical protein [Pedobacter terrae]